ncbi:unnamed protein product [Camellia sinensis]
MISLAKLPTPHPHPHPHHILHSSLSSLVSSHFRVLSNLPPPFKMKIFTNHHMLQEPRKEEFNDWPHGFLAIGTFGNNSLREDPERCNILESSSQNHHHLHDNDLPPEEVGQFEKELAILLSKQVSTESRRSSTEELVEITHNLQLGNFNFPTSLEDDKNSNIDTVWDDSADKKSDRLQRSICSTSVILNRGKDIRADHSKNAIGRTSLCFLLKKMFLCRNGFTSPTLSLRDPIPEKSRMEKLYYTRKYIPRILVQIQRLLQRNTWRQFLICTTLDNNEGEMLDTAANDGSKWVKTDSECKIITVGGRSMKWDSSSQTQVDLSS